MRYQQKDLPIDLIKTTNPRNPRGHLCSGGTALARPPRDAVASWNGSTRASVSYFCTGACS
jgi:hypothetical protein